MTTTPTRAHRVRGWAVKAQQILDAASLPAGMRWVIAPGDDTFIEDAEERMVSRAFATTSVLPDPEEYRREAAAWLSRQARHYTPEHAERARLRVRALLALDEPVEPFEPGSALRLDNRGTCLFPALVARTDQRERFAVVFMDGTTSTMHADYVSTARESAAIRAMRWDLPEDAGARELARYDQVAFTLTDDAGTVTVGTALPPEGDVLAWWESVTPEGRVARVLYAPAGAQVTPGQVFTR